MQEEVNEKRILPRLCQDDKDHPENACPSCTGTEDDPKVESGCGLGSAGSEASGCTGGNVPIGWKCPICYRGIAPWVTSCGCNGKKSWRDLYEEYYDKLLL